MTERREQVSGTTVVRTEPGAPRWRLVYAPGASSTIDDPFGAYLSEHLPPQGIAVVRFQFPYMEAGSRRPDRPPVLEQTWRDVLATCRGDGVPLIASGRSMGGRYGSLIAAKGEPIDRLVLFAYPLRAPQRPGQVRTGHLPDIPVPALFLSGTRDAFGTPDELAGAVKLVPQGTLHLLDGADHGFNVLKRSGRTREDVWHDAVVALTEWLGAG